VINLHVVSMAQVAGKCEHILCRVIAAIDIGQETPMGCGLLFDWARPFHQVNQSRACGSNDASHDSTAVIIHMGMLHPERTTSGARTHRVPTGTLLVPRYCRRHSSSSCSSSCCSCSSSCSSCSSSCSSCSCSCSCWSNLFGSWVQPKVFTARMAEERNNCWDAVTVLLKQDALGRAGPGLAAQGASLFVNPNPNPNNSTLMVQVLLYPRSLT